MKQIKFISIFVLGFVLLSFISALSLNIFTNGLSSGSLSFSGNENKSLNLSIPVRSNVTIGSFDVSSSESYKNAWNLTADTTKGFYQEVGTSYDFYGIYLSPIGDKMYVVETDNSVIIEYNLSSSWEISTASYIQNISTLDIGVAHIYFKNDGSKLYQSSINSDAIIQFTCSKAWNISSCTSDNKNVSSKGNAPTGFSISPDGYTLLMIDRGTGYDKILQFSLTTPWDISTATYDDINLSTQSFVPEGLFVSSDGYHLYESDDIDARIYKYNCLSSWDLSSCSYSGDSYNLGIYGTGVFWKDDGEIFYFTKKDEAIYQRNITSEYSLPSNPSIYLNGSSIWSLKGAEFQGSNAILDELNDTSLYYEDSFASGGENINLTFNIPKNAEVNSAGFIFFSNYTKTTVANDACIGDGRSYAYFTAGCAGVEGFTRMDYDNYFTVGNYVIDGDYINSDTNPVIQYAACAWTGAATGDLRFYITNSKGRNLVASVDVSTLGLCPSSCGSTANLITRTLTIDSSDLTDGNNVVERRCVNCPVTVTNGGKCGTLTYGSPPYGNTAYIKNFEYGKALENLTITSTAIGTSDNYTNGFLTSGINQPISLNTTKLSDYLSSCQDDSTGLCNVPISISATSSGDFNITSLNINYTNISTINFKDTLNTALGDGAGTCPGGIIEGNNCTVTFDFHSDTAGVMEYSSLSVDYNLTDQPPTISIVSPSNNTNTSSSVSFICNATDDIQISNVSLYLNGNINVTNSSGLNNTNYTFTKTLSDGDYTWFCSATDNLSQQVNTSTYFIRVDTTNPNVTLNTPIAGYTSNTTAVNLTANVSDNLGIKNSTIYAWWTNGTLFDTSIIYGIAGTISSEVGKVFNFVDGIFKWAYNLFDYAGNEFNSENRTITIDSTAPNITGLSPVDNLFTTTQNQLFNTTITENVLFIKNYTLRIYESDLINYTNTTTTSTQSVSPSYNLTLAYGTYKWNIESCNNNSMCNNSANRSLTVYKDFAITTLTSNVSRLAQKGVSTATFVSAGNNVLTYCNFTVVNSNGDFLVNNLNGTSFGSGLKWNSSSFVANTTGDYIMNVSCLDNYGNSYTKADTFGVTYDLFYSPTNYSFGALVLKNETRSFNITLFDNSDANILFNVTSSIQQPGNFTLTHVSNITLNSLDSVTNQSYIQFSINASNDIGNGTYSGNITLTNSTFNLTKIVYFEYGINPPSGYPQIYDSTGNILCNNDIGGICGNNLEFQQGGSFSQTYKVYNDGYFEISSCYPTLSGEFIGTDFYTFSNDSFSLGVGESISLSLTISTDTSDTPNDYRGQLFVMCNSTNLLGDDSDPNPSNSPFIRLNLITKQVTTPTGGSGGTTSLPKFDTVAIIIPNDITKLFTDLQRAIIYARIVDLQEQKKDFSDDNLEDLRKTLLDYGISLTLDQIRILIEQFKINEIENVKVTEDNIEIYDLVQESITIEKSEFKITPPNINTYARICLDGSERSWSYPVNSNKLLKSCQVESGKFICKIVDNTKAEITYNFKGETFFVTTLKGKIKFISAGGEADFTTINTLNVINYCYKADIGGLEISIWIIVLGGGVIFISGGYFLFRRTNGGKAWKKIKEKLF